MSTVLDNEPTGAEGDRVEPAAAEQPVFQQLIELTDDEYTVMLDEMKQQYTECRDFMKMLRPRMLKNYKRYRSIADQPKDRITGQAIKGRSNLFIPYPYAIVESEMPRLAGRLPRIRAFPRQETKRAKVDVIQDNLYYTFDRMGFIEKCILWLRQHSIYGWSPIYCFWRKESRNVLTREFDEGLKTHRLVKKEKDVWDDFDIVVLDVWDSFMQPGVEDAEDGDLFFFREWWSKRDIQIRVDAGLFYPDTMKKLEEGGSDVSLNDEGRADRDELSGFKKDQKKWSYGTHEVTYRLENDRLSIMIDRKVLAKVGDNPHPLQRKAIINMCLRKMIGEPVGISTIEQLGGLPDKLNALSNARLDNIALLINRVFLARRHSQTDFNNLRFSPANIILTDDLDSIKMLDVQDVGQSSEREILTPKEEMQFVSHISDYTVGVKSAARLSDTATGVSSIIREANASFALQLAAFESGPLRKLVEYAHAYCMLYQPLERWIHVHGPDGWLSRQVTVDDILCECDLTIEPGSSVPLDQLSRRDYITSTLPMAMRAPQIVNQRKLWREVFEAGDFRNVDDMLLPEDKSNPLHTEAELIMAENLALLQGQTIELRGDDRMHIQGHLALLNQPQYHELEETMQGAVTAHIQAHMKRFAQTSAAASQAGQNVLFGGPNGGNPAAAGAGPGAPLSLPAGTQAGVQAPEPGAVPALAGAVGTA